MNNKIKRTIGLFTALVLFVTAMTACGSESTTEVVLPEEPVVEESDGILRVGYSALSGRLNPFYPAAADDKLFMGLTQVTPLLLDRVGDVVEKGISGETVSYGGVDYSYSGICDITLFMDEAADIAEYTVRIRDDIFFWDGHKMDIDDVIFSMYVLCDPSYDGGSAVRYSPICGLDNYITDSDDEEYLKYGAEFDKINAAGFGHIWSWRDKWKQGQQDAYDTAVLSEWKKDIAAVTEYCVSSYAEQYSEQLIGISSDTVISDENYHTAFAMAAWGFAKLDGGVFTTALGSTFTLTDGDLPTQEDFYNEVFTVYEGDPEAYWEDANGGEVDSDTVISAARNAYIYQYSESTVSVISGIERIDDHTVRILTDGYNASDIYSILDFYVAPLHYYGSEELYSYSDGVFGFERGDLSSVTAKDGVPLGAGMYVFESQSGGTVSLVRNSNYYASEPLTEKIELVSLSDGSPVDGIMNELSFDVIVTGGNSSTVDEITGANSNGELTGDMITTIISDADAYGYIGINAETVKVGEDKDSEESMDLRRALATVFSVYRDEAVDAYYGQSARVVNYPMSETSYIAYDRTDENYRTAFSLSDDGGEIYNDIMTPADKYQAALNAATEYFIAAGYIYDEEIDKFVAAPEGASLSFEVIVPGGGAGDHPSYGIMKAAAEALGKRGIVLSITDPTGNSLMWGRLRSGSQQIWCAAHTVTPEPKMRDNYYSSSALTTLGGNYHGLSDEILDYYIASAEINSDRMSRLMYYRDAIDIILEWAVEVPVYQRQSFILFSSESVDAESIPEALTAYYPWYREAHLIALK